MERWSSHTSTLAMHHLRVVRLRNRFYFGRLGMQNFQNELCSALRAGIGINSCAMCLHDLIDDCQSKAGTALKLRLERLEDLFHQVSGDTRPGVTNPDAPLLTREPD